MPSKKQYNLVHNDEYDTRIPLHSEEAFHRGIVFHAKVIWGDFLSTSAPYAHLRLLFVSLNPRRIHLEAYTSAAFYRASVFPIASERV